MSAKPFLKWAGGKGQLLEQFLQLYPAQLNNSEIENYIEPFLGGGACFFKLAQNFRFNNVILNDINTDIMIAYKTIQMLVPDLIIRLEYLQNQYYGADDKKIMYYNIRDNFNEQKETVSFLQPCREWIDFTANLIFLNRTCFNGLYRLNSKGKFNVPIGSYKNPLICDATNLREVSELLQNVRLTNVDFEQSISLELDPRRTFVYIDPPYRPLPNSPSFTSYSAFRFDDESQIRLGQWYRELTREGYYVMLSNSDPTDIDPNDTFFDRLYSEFTIYRVSASRNINSKGEGRSAIPEIVVTNY